MKKNCSKMPIVAVILSSALLSCTNDFPSTLSDFAQTPSKRKVISGCESNSHCFIDTHELWDDLGQDVLIFEDWDEVDELLERWENIESRTELNDENLPLTDNARVVS